MAQSVSIDPWYRLAFNLGTLATVDGLCHAAEPDPLGGVTKHPDMPIELAAANGSDARLIESLLDDYLRELSSYRDVPVGAIDSATYPYLDAYWSEPGRHAFLLQYRGRAVGFALIRDPASTGSAVHQLAEFYVKPESRRLGIGRCAVFAIWKRFPGQWELQVHARNSAAVQFWASCAEGETTEAPQVREVQAGDGRRVQFNFRVGPAAQHGRCS